MAGTRSSTRKATDTNSSPPSAKGTNGTKRKADNASPANNKSKRGRQSKTKEQKTLEETMPDADTNNGDQVDSEMKQAEPEVEADGEGKNGFHRPDGCWFWPDKVAYDAPDVDDQDQEKIINQPGDSFKGKTKDGESKDDPEKALKDLRNGSGMNALDQVKADENDTGSTSKEQEEEDDKQDDAANANGKMAIEENEGRAQEQPSNILEKGIIYFFTRGRVGIDDPNSPQDLQRSYFVLRPLPAGAKLTDGAIQDDGNNRLIAVPKKVWPKSGRDKFMAFVEKGKTNMSTLKEEFFQGSDYSTKTTGTRHTPAIAPIGEGVYAMTSTGSGRPTTHLAYMLTIPSEVGEVQKDVGLAEKGSFVLSLKNPESSGPSYAQLPEGPDYPKEFIEEFGGRGWMPVAPKHLDYANAQMLLIGENFEDSGNLEPTSKDEKDDAKETPAEELEKLEHEDDLRVEHMKGDDTIFADLGISSKEYPKVMTTW